MLTMTPMLDRHKNSKVQIRPQRRNLKYILRITNQENLKREMTVGTLCEEKLNTKITGR